MNIVLVEPEIPPNTGNIARLCAATGTTLHLIGPLGFKFNDKTLQRAGMDYWKHVTWKYWDSLAALQTAAGSEARYFYATTKSNRPYTTPRYRPDDHLVFGRETAGLPAALLAANAGHTITIPMFNPAARSLNLATAVAIILFHSLWQTTGWEGWDPRCPPLP